MSERLHTHANGDVHDIRCVFCDKLLAKGSVASAFEIKCSRCGSLNAIIEGINEQVTICDLEGRILYMNRAAERETGYTTQDVIGKKTSDLWGDRMTAEFYEDMWRLMRGGSKSFRSTMQYCTKSGRMYEADLTMSPVLDPRGAAIFYVGIEVVKKREA